MPSAVHPYQLLQQHVTPQFYHEILPCLHLCFVTAPDMMWVKEACLLKGVQVGPDGESNSRQSTEKKKKTAITCQLVRLHDRRYPITAVIRSD